jgi:hypothetical protein
MEKKCIVCETDSQQVPLVRLDYRDQEMWICPQHIPVLIHHPEQLVGKLPGAEEFKAG